MSRSTSKSAVSRKFAAMTETAVADLLGKELTDLDLVALMIDGVYFAEHLCVVALGIDIDGTKHPLGLVDGSTEDTTVVKQLLTGLRDRGPEHHQVDPRGAGRRQGAGGRRPRGVRPAGDLSVSATRVEESGGAGVRGLEPHEAGALDGVGKLDASDGLVHGRSVRPAALNASRACLTSGMMWTRSPSKVGSW